MYVVDSVYIFFFFQAEDGIRVLVRSRGLGDVYKRQSLVPATLKSISPAKSSASAISLRIIALSLSINNLSLIHI